MYDLTRLYKYQLVELAKKLGLRHNWQARVAAVVVAEINEKFTQNEIRAGLLKCGHSTSDVNELLEEDETSRPEESTPEEIPAAPAPTPSIKSSQKETAMPADVTHAQTEAVATMLAKLLAQGGGAGKPGHRNRWRCYEADARGRRAFDRNHRQHQG